MFLEVVKVDGLEFWVWAFVCDLEWTCPYLWVDVSSVGMINGFYHPPFDDDKRKELVDGWVY